MMRLRSFAAAVFAALTLACSEPPYKEMHQAQGALDAARAAGGPTFATEEFRDAERALQQSQDAVEQRDYRLALRYALDASERAQDAARAAADRKAEARGRAERTLAAAESAIRDAEARVKASPLVKTRARELAPARKVIADSRDTLQKARAAMEREAYLDVGPTLEPVHARLAEAIRDVAEREARRPARARRPGRSRE
jgi:hypothetical protein